MNQEKITYQYKFNFNDDSAKTFDIVLDARTLEVVNQEPATYPEWTALSCCKCPPLFRRSAPSDFCGGCQPQRTDHSRLFRQLHRLEHR